MTSALSNNPPVEPQHVLITGGAGYIGSLLTGVLLSRGHHVTVVDDLLFGGESLLGYWHHPSFKFLKGDVCDPEVLARLKSGEPQSRIRVPFGCSGTLWVFRISHGFRIPNSAFRIG